MGEDNTEMQAETPAYVEELAALNKQYYGLVPKVKLQKLQQKHGCGVVPDRVQTARRAQLREIFLRVNNTESITPSEFKKALTGKRKDGFRAVLQTQGKNWKDVFAAIDTDHDGAVSCFEFVTAVSTLPQAQTAPTGGGHEDLDASTIVRPAEMEDQGAMRAAASDDSFIPVKKYDSEGMYIRGIPARPGYQLKTGARGHGYYKDTPEEMARQRRAQESRQRRAQERLDNRNYVTEDDQRLRDSEDRLKQALSGSLSELSSTRPKSHSQYDRYSKADQGPFDDDDELRSRIDDYKKCGGTRLLHDAEELSDALTEECRVIYFQYHD